MNGNDIDRFDRALRDRHDEAVDRLSPRMRAQLAQRRNAALRGDARPVRHGFRYAAGFAALCALAIGLQLQRPADVAPVPQANSGAAIATASRDDTLLDEDPEFYAWLASSDARQLAME